MPDILLMCPEPLGHGHPAGVGIRFIEFARALLRRGHRVAVLSPDGGEIEGCRSETATPDSIRRFTSESDAVIVQGHIANELFAHGEVIPTVVDLYDPYIIENLHYSRTHGEEVFVHDHATLLRSIRRGDYFLCASETQRSFYLGLMLAAARLNPEIFEGDPALDSLVAIVPFGVQHPREAPPKVLTRPAAFFGGIYNWYDPRLAIEAVRLARTYYPSLTLTFTEHPNAAITPQGLAAETRNLVDTMGYDFIHFDPWVPYAERAAAYDRHTFGLLTFGRSLETDLSMRTRLFDFLWGSLPVISSSARGTDEILEKYRAGMVVSSTSPERFADAIVNLLSDETRYGQFVNGAAAFTANHQWDRVLAPLLEFCDAPRIDATKARFAADELPTPRGGSILARLRRKIGA